MVVPVPVAVRVMWLWKNPVDSFHNWISSTTTRSESKIIEDILGANYTQHCMPIFKSQSIITVYDQVTLENIKLIHRIVNGNIAVSIANLFEKNEVCYEIRSSGPQMKAHYSTKYNNSFYVNLLPIGMLLTMY